VLHPHRLRDLLVTVREQPAIRRQHPSCTAKHPLVSLEAGLERVPLGRSCLEYPELTHQTAFDFAHHDGTTELHEFARL
jgi:hypothetical protein